MFDLAVGNVNIEFSVVVKIGEHDPESRIRQAGRAGALGRDPVCKDSVRVYPESVSLGFQMGHE